MFDILAHIDQLQIIQETSYNYECICPYCSSSNLKINKSTGYWKCWTCEEVKKIRDLISPPKSRVGIPRELKPSDIFRPRSSIKLKPLPVDPPAHIEFLCTNECGLIPSRQYKNYTFDYSDTQRIVRITNSEGKKQCFYSSRESNTSAWQWTKGTQLWPPLYYEEIVEQKRKQESGNAVVFVEGEKTAKDFCRFGLIASTVPPHSWNENWIRHYCKVFRELGIEHILYLPDNDKVGGKKATLIQDSCFFQDFSCEILNLAQLNFLSYSLKDRDDFFDIPFSDKINIIYYINEQYQHL